MTLKDSVTNACEEWLDDQEEADIPVENEIGEIVEAVLAEQPNASEKEVLQLIKEHFSDWPEEDD